MPIQSPQAISGSSYEVSRTSTIGGPANTVCAQNGFLLLSGPGTRGKAPADLHEGSGHTQNSC